MLGGQSSQNVGDVTEEPNHHPNTVAAGDFNLKGTNLWIEVPSATNQATSAQQNRPLPFMEEFSLTHHVKCPTLAQHLRRPRTYYFHYILTFISNVCPVSGISDHMAILFHINVKASRPLNFLTRFLFTKGLILMAWGMFLRHIQSSCNVNKYSLYPSSVIAWNQLPLFISDFHFSSMAPSYFHH